MDNGEASPPPGMVLLPSIGDTGSQSPAPPIDLNEYRRRHHHRRLFHVLLLVAIAWLLLEVIE